MCPSLIQFPGTETGILHDGAMIGNDRNTDRTRLKSLEDVEEFLLRDGWREMGGLEGEPYLSDFGNVGGVDGGCGTPMMS